MAPTNENFKYTNLENSVENITSTEDLLVKWYDLVEKISKLDKNRWEEIKKEYDELSKKLKDIRNQKDLIEIATQELNLRVEIVKISKENQITQDAKTDLNNLNNDVEFLFDGKNPEQLREYNINKQVQEIIESKEKEQTLQDIYSMIDKVEEWERDWDDMLNNEQFLPNFIDALRINFKLNFDNSKPEDFFKILQESNNFDDNEAVWVNKILKYLKKLDSKYLNDLIVQNQRKYYINKLEINFLEKTDNTRKTKHEIKNIVADFESEITKILNPGDKKKVDLKLYLKTVDDFHKEYWLDIESWLLVTWAWNKETEILQNISQKDIDDVVSWKKKTETIKKEQEEKKTRSRKNKKEQKKAEINSAKNINNQTREYKLNPNFVNYSSWHDRYSVSLKDNTIYYRESDWKPKNIKVSNQEKEIIQKNPETIKNIVDLQKTCSDLKLWLLYENREEIFKALKNKYPNFFDQEDDYLNTKEQNLFLTQSMKTLWFDLENDLKTIELQEKIKELNLQSNIIKQEEVNNKWDSKIEAKFREKFLDENLKFKFNVFEQSLKVI